jgi:hypothetical protein
MRVFFQTIALILFSSLLCFSQEYEYVPFPTENAQWNLDVYDGNCMPPGLCSQNQIQITGDTVCNGHTYTMFDNRAWFREDVTERKIYAMWSNQNPPNFEEAMEYLAYDFSLSIGDTFHVPPPMNIGGFPEGPIYIISYIDTIEIGNGLRKRFHFISEETIGTNDFWIEGIGGDPGPFYPHYVFEVWTTLRCFTHNDEILYSNPLGGPWSWIQSNYPWYEHCDPDWVWPGDTVGVAEHERLEWTTVLTVHGGELRIPYLSTGQTRYALYSMLGQQLMEGNLTGDALQLPNLPPGIFVLRLSGTHRQTVFKLINP